jgi:hypothetical protein
MFQPFQTFVSPRGTIIKYFAFNYWNHWNVWNIWNYLKQR